MSQNLECTLALIASLSLGALAFGAAPPAPTASILVQVTQLKAQNANDEALQAENVQQLQPGQVNRHRRRTPR